MSTAPAGSQPAPPPARPRGPRLLLLLALALAVGGAAVGGWWLLRPHGPNPPAAPEGAASDARAAIDDARKDVLADPKSGAAWGRLGLVFTAHGLDEPAAECYREAHRLDPADERWPYMLGLYNLHEGRDPAAAVGYLEAALACRHRNKAKEAAVRLRLAELYLSERRLADAERLFREQLTQDPADPRGRLGLGVTLLNADRPAEAAELLKGATDSPSTRRQAAANLAIAARQLGDPAAAARYEQEAASLPEDQPPPDPFTAEAAALRPGRKDGYEQVAALERAGQFRETIPILTRMVADDPSDVRAAVNLGQNLALVGDLEAAARHLRAASARDPQHVKAAELLGTVLFDLARRETDPERRAKLYRESAEACRRAVELKPDLAMAHFCRGKATQGLGDLPGAVPHFRRAVECHPEVADFQIGLLQALLDAGMTKEAAAQLPAAERVIPADNPELSAIRKRLGNVPKPETKS